MPADTQPATTTENRLLPTVAQYDVVVVTSIDRKKTFPYGLAAAFLILASVLLRVVYLVGGCPLDLAPDEAHYWHWSRHLDWSYYSKGPLVAWLIRASCELFGNETFAVRLPAVACHALLLAGLYVLARDTLGSPRTALAVVAVALTLPPVSAAAVLMTIDAPFLACWCWALVFAWKAVTTERLRWWLAMGLCSALGMLAKYPMLLLPLMVGAFLFVRRPHELRRRGFWLMVLLTGVGCMPIVVWNAANGWVSFRHVLGQAGIGERTHGVRWLGPLAFAGGQAAVLLGYWFVAFTLGAWKYRPGRVSDNALSFLWWVSVPVWGVFLAASFRTAGQVNWPAAAYVAGLVLAVAVVKPYLAAWRSAVGWLAAAIIAGLAVSVVAHYPGLMRPLLVQIAGQESNATRPAIRRLDPTCRLRGWHTLSQEIDAIRDRVRVETGRDPVLAAMVWTTPGELSFYCRGQPEAYSFGAALADRHSQYDLWRPNPVADAQVFRGCSFVYVGEEIPDAAAVFDRIESPIRVVHAEDGVPVAVWSVWVCHGFRGFPPRSATDY